MSKKVKRKPRGTTANDERFIRFATRETNMMRRRYRKLIQTPK